MGALVIDYRPLMAECARFQLLATVMVSTSWYDRQELYVYHVVQ